ncbi:uncharacterized protein LOC125242231 isoform X2 [Leguminivora glycinivorella]|uniref:uncharacterized protein LOC125242231 isoform X2 n=1 Tax=Leguminivora glycinivorella TaxID=1035111 RepID=UPI00200E1EDF|nr:uncharacterized protein LOC125242231 isoform X2 [Leguminivora glycinivorella]
MDGVFKNCTLHEALAILEEDSDYEVNQIFVEPPEPNIHSDEDSGDEDDGALLNNLSGRQLNARCKVVLSSASVSNLRRSRRLLSKRSMSPPLDFTPTAHSSSNVASGRKRGAVVSWACSRGRGRGVTIRNAWSLSRKSGNPINQLDFGRHIVQTYLLRFRNLPRGPGRPLTSRQSKTGRQVSDELRYDAIAHYLIPCPEGVRRRCGYEYCKSQSRLQCSKCNVGLCAKFNYRFHTQ